MLQGKFFIKNTLSNYGIIVLRMLIGIWALPVYLQAFGKEYYGLFLLAFELPQILSFLDMGAAKSVLRFTAQYRLDKDIDKYQQSLSVNITLAVFTSFIVALAILGVGFTSFYIYDLDGDQYKTAIGLFAVSAVCSFFIFLDFIPQNILSGSNIFHDRNKIQLVSVLYSLCLVAAVKYAGISLFGFSLLFAIGYLLIFFLDIWLIQQKKILADVAIKLVSFSQVIKSGLLGYNLQLFSLSLIAVFSSQADKQIVGIVVSVQAVTVYVIITKAYYVARGLLANIYTVMRPSLAVAKQYPVAYMQKFFLTTTQSIALVLALLSVYLYFLWPVLSNIWLRNNEYAVYSAFVSLSVINLALSALAGTFISYFTLTDEALVVVKTDFFTVLINVIISVICCFKFGPAGAIMGTTAQMLLNAVWYIYLGWRKKLIHFPSYFSIGFISLAVVFIFDYLVMANFILPLSIQVLICFLTSLFVLYHLYRLNIYSMLTKKINAAV